LRIRHILVYSPVLNLTTTDIGRMERLRGGCALGGGVAAELQNWLQTVYRYILVYSLMFNLTTDIGRMERLRGGCALGGGVAAALQNWLQTALAVQVIVIFVFYDMVICSFDVPRPVPVPIQNVSLT
jgi:hypothetical protein